MKALISVANNGVFHLRATVFPESGLRVGIASQYGEHIVEVDVPNDVHIDDVANIATTHYFCGDTKTLKRRKLSQNG
jgi:hypothetical protein